MRISDWSSDVCSSDLIVLPDRGRGAFDDIDDERIGEPPRHPRVLNPAIFHQVSAHPRQVDRRHRAVLLRARDVLNLESVDAFGADDFDLLDLKAGAGDRLGPFLLNLPRNPGRMRPHRHHTPTTY